MSQVHRQPPSSPSCSSSSGITFPSTVTVRPNQSFLKMNPIHSPASRASVIHFLQVCHISLPAWPLLSSHLIPWAALTSGKCNPLLSPQLFRAPVLFLRVPVPERGPQHRPLQFGCWPSSVWGVQSLQENGCSHIGAPGPHPQLQQRPGSSSCPIIFPRAANFWEARTHFVPTWAACHVRANRGTSE